MDPGGRRLLVAVMAVMAVCASPAPAQGQPPNIVRMLSYNVHWAEQTDAGTGRWTGRLDLGRIAREIRRSGAEVALLQEVHRYRRAGGRALSQAHELAKLLGWTKGGVRRHVLFQGSSPVAIWCRRRDGTRVVKWMDGRAGRCRAHGNAILSRRPLLRGGFLDLFRPGLEGLSRDLYGTDEGRSALRAAIRVDGRLLWLATTHLARWPAVSTCQLRDLLHELRGVRPLVLGGDFNLEVDTLVPQPRCDDVLERPLDQLPAAGFSRAVRGMRTFPAYRPVEAIDHFFATEGVELAGVRPLDNCRRSCSSDHRPLAARALVRTQRAAEVLDP